MSTASLQSITASLVLHAAMLGFAARSESPSVPGGSNGRRASAETLIAFDTAAPAEATDGAGGLEGAAPPADERRGAPAGAEPASIAPARMPPVRERAAASLEAPTPRVPHRKTPARKPASAPDATPPRALVSTSPPAPAAVQRVTAQRDAAPQSGGGVASPGSVAGAPSGPEGGGPTSTSGANGAGRGGSGSPSAGMGPPGAGRGGGGPDRARLLAAYIERVRARVAQHRQYPYVARRAKLEGTVCLRVSLAASGDVLGVTPTCGASQRPLLNAAIESVSSAAPFPPLPKALGQRLTLEVPVVFALAPP